MKIKADGDDCSCRPCCSGNRMRNIFLVQMVWHESKSRVHSSSSCEINYNNLTLYCKFKVIGIRYCGSPRSEFRKADLYKPLMYSTGSCTSPAGLGRLIHMATGHRWIQVLQTHSQQRTKNIKGDGQAGVLLVLETGKREDKSRKGKSTLYSPLRSSW